MKKLLSHLLQSAFLALLAAPAFLFFGCSDGSDSGALNSRGILKNSFGIAHVNLVAAKKTEAGQALQKKFWEKVSKRDREEYEAFKTATGFDLEKDITSVTAGMFFLPNKEGTPVAMTVTILRGTYSPEKIWSYINKKAEGKGYSPQILKVDGLNVLVDGYRKGYCFVDGKVAFIVSIFKNPEDEQMLAEAAKITIEALRDKSQSYVIPQPLFDLEKKLKNPAFLVQADIARMPDIARVIEEIPMGKGMTPRLVGGQVGVAETDGKTKLRVTLQYETAERAEAVKGLAILGREQLKKELDGKEKLEPEQRLAKAAIEKEKLTTEGSTFIVEDEVPAAEVVNLINTLFN